MRVALLSGGTGGAKLARGLLDEVGAEELTVIANTGDDAWVYGVHVSPDPDLVTYWLADAIDERGYGIRDDSWQVMEALAAAGRPTWFRLGDRDLAMCLTRSEQLAAGTRLTDAHAAVVGAMGVGARVLPMCDEPVPTRIGVGGRVLPFQEFMIVEQARGPLESVAFDGVERARPTDEVLAALRDADVVVIGPSNPIVSIGPILALPGMREALIATPAPVVAVSPFVGGRVLKGPTELFCRFAGVEPSATGIAGLYAGLIDGLVADEPVEGLPAAEVPTLMDGPASRRQLARATLELATTLSTS
ncbi:MAG TPA: 2-phospho-L-lactate transferase [Thermoleophilaceae bacterium]|nr:2-phospho-L-lactate transferase [Thermoleophilaceae bacterium]